MVLLYNTEPQRRVYENRLATHMSHVDLPPGHDLTNVLKTYTGAAQSDGANTWDDIKQQTVLCPKKKTDRREHISTYNVK